GAAALGDTTVVCADCAKAFQSAVPALSGGFKQGSAGCTARAAALAHAFCCGGNGAHVDVVGHTRGDVAGPVPVFGRSDCHSSTHRLFISGLPCFQSHPEET